MSRPLWKGFITFGLVNIPVMLYSAEKRFDLHFKLLDSRDKARIHYERVNEQTGEEVPWEDVVKAYEYAEDNYVILKQEEIERIAPENVKTINIENFINIGSLDCKYFEKPYYLIPDKKGDKGYVLLREALKATKSIGIAKVIIRTREYLAALMPSKNALILNLMRYYQEIRQPSEFDLPTMNIKQYKITPKEMDIAKQLINSMTTEWKPESYHNEYRETLMQWIENKIKAEGKGVTKKIIRQGKSTQKATVINFVDLLKKSLNKGKKIKTKPIQHKFQKTKTRKK